MSKSQVTKESLKHSLKNRFADDKITVLSKLPHPYTFKDMQKAAARIIKAVKNGEKIAVVADYDVDGVCSAAIMSEFFELISCPIQIVIPNRFTDGYGFSEKIAESLDASLIVTVDNGIAAHAAAEVCQKRGVDLIITDHHTVPETLPHAYAIVHPKQEGCEFAYKEICAATIAWYLCGALKAELGLKVDMKQFLDLVAIATVADVMPLRCLNRTIVKNGLEVIGSTDRAAILAIREKFLAKQLTSMDIAFQIAPRINSAGRLDNAVSSFNFLTSKTMAKAYETLNVLDELNANRKLIEQQTTEAATIIASKCQGAIVVWGDDWHEGVVGIVASRLTRSFGLPAVVLSVQNGIAKGSARSVGEIDIYELMAPLKELLISFGGHKMAAGVSLKVENLQRFSDELSRTALNLPKELFFSSKGQNFGELPFNEIDDELLELLDMFEPFGEGNEKPLFLCDKKRVTSIDYQNEKMIKFSVSDGNKKAQAISFGGQKHIVGDEVSFEFYVQKNSYNGKTRPLLFVERYL